MAQLKRTFGLLMSGFIGFILFVSAARIATAVPDETSSVLQSKMPVSPNIKPLGRGRFQIGNIVLDKTSQTLSVPANVNMRQGMIELVACSSGGKLHESVFWAKVEPYDLQIALLLLGLKPGGGVKYQGDETRPKGDLVEIYVENGKKRRRVEDCIWDKIRGAPMQRTGWVFTGSKILEDGQFASQQTRTLITTYRDPYTILDNPLATGADDTVYEVNHRVMPPVGTTVTLIIQPYRKTFSEGGKTK